MLFTEELLYKGRIDDGIRHTEKRILRDIEEKFTGNTPESDIISTKAYISTSRLALLKDNESSFRARIDALEKETIKRYLFLGIGIEDVVKDYENENEDEDKDENDIDNNDKKDAK
jgi:hypothetical protein